MQNILSHLPKISLKKKKRLGRGLGSGRGAKSGRGITRHQKARESIPLHFEGGQARMIKKFPLLRGKARNKSIRGKPVIISLEDLNVYKSGEVVDAESLVKKGLIEEKSRKYGIKILANGNVDKKLTIKVAVSQAVKEEIEKIGGKVEI